jgi:hypothetical protein
VLGVPAVRLVALQHVLGEGDVGIALDADVVVVVDQDQIAESLVAREATCLGGDPLLQTTVTGDDVDPVVEQAVTRIGGLIRIAHTWRASIAIHCGGEPLTQCPRGRLDPYRCPYSGCPGVRLPQVRNDSRSLRVNP